MSFKDMTDGLLKVTDFTFGEPIVYMPINSDEEIRTSGIFDETSEEIDPNTAALIVSRKPLLDIIDASLNNIIPREGDRVIIRSKTYKVIELLPDGQGGTQLRLHKA